jgi:hypothetical protein
VKSKIIKTIIPFMLFTIIFYISCTKEVFVEIKQNQPEPEIYEASIGSIAKKELLQLIPWGDNAISISIPIGWNIYSGGECSTKSVLSRDPCAELKQLFYFSEAGPVYTSQQLKENDKNYMDIGGYDILWFESPVVNPLTAENYLKNFGILAEFRQNNKLGEGYFYIVTADVFGLGYGMMFTGITAPKGLLDLIVPSLLQSFKSFTVNSDYVDACIKAQNNAAAGALEAGRILDHSSDTIMEVWENKLESEQRMSEKQSDAMLGYSRLYNPQTDEVYEITPEFYEYYQNHSNEFELNYLQEMPDDKWSYAPLNGVQYIK